MAHGIMDLVDELLNQASPEGTNLAPQQMGDAPHKGHAQEKPCANVDQCDGVTMISAGDERQVAVVPKFRIGFRANDSATEPNYYVELALHNGPSPSSEPFRLMVLLYTPRNPWDKRPWPINVQPALQPYLSFTPLNHGNSMTFLQTLERQDHPGFHLLSGFETRAQNITLFPADLILVNTLEVFGPDLVADWVLETGRGQIRGTTRCSRPVAPGLPWRFRERSRLQVELCNTQVTSTPDGNRLLCDLVIREHDYRISLSCWADCLDQWGNDLTAKYLVMDGLKQALRDTRSRIALERAQGRHDSSRLDGGKSPLELLADQLLVEAPIRFDTFYAEIIQHYTAAGDLERIPHLRREWEEALSQLTLPDVSGLEGII